MSKLRDGADLPEDAASGMRFGVVVSRFNDEITTRLAEGAVELLHRHGARADDIVRHAVPGAYELPMEAHRMAASKMYDAIVCVGALIRGETPHFDVLASSVAGAIQAAARQTGVPIAFGLITCDTAEQAAARAGGRHGNKGTEAAVAAIEMARLFRTEAGS